jgi:hypothetical protein
MAPHKSLLFAVAFFVLGVNNRSGVQGSALPMTVEIDGLIEEEILVM